MTSFLSNTYEIPLNLGPAALRAIEGPYRKDLRGDLFERLVRHINRINTGASVNVEWDRQVVVLATEVPRKAGGVERIVDNWKGYWSHLLTPPPPPPPKVPGKTLADRVLSARDSVVAIEGSTTVDQATRDELVALLQELATAAEQDKKETQVQPCAGGAWHRRFVADVSA